MKIILENFLCYENATFELGEKGMTLITGMSGCGKTSIMRGIIYALFGTVKTSSKIQRFGQKSCKVILIFDKNLKIERTQCPNYLKVNDCLVEAEAQDFINRYVGSAFNMSGYIPQHPFRSFIMLSPADKLEFLEEHTSNLFGEFNPDKIKERTQKEISLKKTELNKTIGQIDIIRSQLDDFSENSILLVEPKFPVNCSDDNKPVIKSNRLKRLEKANNKIKIYQSNLEKIFSKISDSRLANREREFFSKELEKSELELENVNKFLEKFPDAPELSLKLKNCKSDLNIISKQKEYEQLLTLSNQLKHNKEEIIKEEKIRLETLSNSLKKELVNIEDLKDNYKVLKELIIDSRKIEQLYNELPENNNIKNLEELRTKINSEILFSGKILESKKEKLNLYKLELNTYNCPSCKASLSFQNNNLILIDTTNSSFLDRSIEDLENEILSESRKLKKLNKSLEEISLQITTIMKIRTSIREIENLYEEKLPSSEDIQDQINSCVISIKEQSHARKKLSSIEYELSNLDTENVSVSRAISQLNEIEKKISEIPTLDQIPRTMPHLNEIEINNFIDENQDKILNFNRKSEKRIELETEINKIKIKLDNVKNSLERLNYYEEKLDECKKIISFTESEKKINEKTLEDITKWEHDISVWNKYSELQKKYNELLKSEETIKSEYNAALKLKTKLVEAESIVLDNIVQQIALHAQQYLNCFFPNTPLSIELKTFKESKTSKITKPKINAILHYGDITNADIDMLSGGETARVILAYTLALGEIFQTPLLMLDESTASLDEELTTEVFNTIRQHTENKLVLVVAHQVITGTFDKTIILQNT